MQQNPLMQHKQILGRNRCYGVLFSILDGESKEPSF